MLRVTSLLRASWSSTLQLPKSALPPRPPIPSPYLQRCTDDLYTWQSSQHNRKKFVLHDGPPYANGSLHLGHALNKILKDIICRFQITQGYRVEYRPGWDCHGLPIEVKALQALKKSHENLSPLEIRKAARKLAAKTVEEQKAGFREWAVMGDWDGAYKTMDKDYELRQLQVFKNMVAKGLIYRARMPVYWSPSSQTALAEAELEYDPEHQSLCAYVQYPLDVEKSHEFASIDGVVPDRLGALIWTTTPWTLPANRAIALNPNMKYCIVTIEETSELVIIDPNSQCLPDVSVATIVAESRLEHLRKSLKKNVTVLKKDIKGETLIGNITYRNPFNQGVSQPLISAPFVTDTVGTGLVHIAPGHGQEDFDVAEAHGIEPFAPVDHKGHFTAEALPTNPDILFGKMVGIEGSKAVLSYLRGISKNENHAYVVKTHNIVHKYPIDWRTKQPVIIKTTDQWFADIGLIKSAALGALEAVKFIPDGGKNRLKAFIEGRSQWCISRQRAWGLPIPALYRVDVSPIQAIMTEDTINHIIKTIQARGIDSWWSDKENELSWIPSGLEGEYIRGKDTMDVWFDSGTSWAQLDHSQNDPPADVYLEGSDQHRGWFQSSLLTFIAQHVAQISSSTPNAPFRTLITHGFALDSEGRKMSKSLGNVISPNEVTQGTLLPPLKQRKSKAKNTQSNPQFDAMGTDVLRYWVASVDYHKDVSIGPEVLKTVQTNVQKIRITLKWILGCLSSFDPKNLESAKDSMTILDEVALHALETVSSTVHSSLTTFNFFRATSALNTYINQDLSAFYFETLKDRLYTGTVSDRLAAQVVLYHIFHETLVMIGPIIPLVVEESWSLMPELLKDGREHPLRQIYTPFHAPIDFDRDQARTTYTSLVSAKRLVSTLQEKLRGESKMGSSLQCDVSLAIQPLEGGVSVVTEELFSEGNRDVLASALVVSQVHIDQKLGQSWTDDNSVILDDKNSGIKYRLIAAVVSPSGEKCERCWRYLELSSHGLCGRCEQVIEEVHPHMLITDVKP